MTVDCDKSVVMAFIKQNAVTFQGAAEMKIYISTRSLASQIIFESLKRLIVKAFNLDRIVLVSAAMQALLNYYFLPMKVTINAKWQGTSAGYPIPIQTRRIEGASTVDMSVRKLTRVFAVIKNALSNKTDF